MAGRDHYRPKFILKDLSNILAESQGFEPRIPLITGYTISSRAPSTSSANSPFVRYQIIDFGPFVCGVF
jgi:hypothetical protein